MHVTGRRLPALALAAVLTLAGCAGSAEETEQSGNDAPAGAPSPNAASASPHDQHDVAEIEIEVENGEVTPSGERVDVEVGQTVRFVVTSDAADEIHVHSVPERTFGFGAGTTDREFAFTVRRPGVIEAELHELGDVVVTIAARP